MKSCLYIPLAHPASFNVISGSSKESPVGNLYLVRHCTLAILYILDQIYTALSYYILRIRGFYRTMVWYVVGVRYVCTAVFYAQHISTFWYVLWYQYYGRHI